MSNPDTTRIFNYPEVTTPASDAKILLDSQTVGSKCIDANLFRCDLIDKTITQRGTFEASEDNADGFKKVVVDIPYTDVHVASGPIATFEGEDLPLKSLTVSIEPQQDLHSYDSPWAGGAGKNKFNIATISVKEYIGENGNLYSSNNWSVSDFISVDSETAYVLSGITNSGSLTKHAFYDSNKVFISAIDSTVMNFTTPSNAKYIRLSLQSETPTNVQFEKGSTATTYAPYSNICPITGYTEANVTRTGKNLFDAQDIVTKSNHTTYTYIEDSYLHYNAGNPTVNGINWYGLNFPCPLTFSGSVKNFASSNENVIFSAIFDDGTQSLISVAHQLTPNEERTFSVIIGVSGKKLVSLANSWASARQLGLNLATTQLEFGSTATTYEPYAGTTYTIPFTDGQGQSVEVYGGSVDVVNGVVTPCPYYASYNGEQLTGEWISDRDVYSPNTTPTTGAQVVNIGATGTSFSVQPTSIKSLDGENNIYANTGDVDVEYQTVWVRPTE